MKPESPTICALPFGHLFLSEEGKNFPCCYALESGEPSRNERGEVIHASRNLEEVWNCADQKKIRLQMLAGEQPRACTRCFVLEKHGLQSNREVSNLRFSGELAKAVSRVEKDGSMPLELYSLDLRLGNLCNLRCQMCKIGRAHV